MELGRRLQEYREAKHITQAEMAKACGLSKNYISAMERGINKCSAKTLISYADKLEISLDILTGRTKESNIIPELKQILETTNEKEQQKILQMIRLMQK